MSILSVVFGFLVYRKIRKVDEALLERALGCGVGLCCESYQALRELVGLQGLEAGDNDVDAHVILVASKKVRLGEVLLD